MENVVLNDPASGASAEVLVSLGFNCHRFTVPHRGRHVDLIWRSPAFLTGTDRPSRSGIPILFPFPGRIRGTEFVWEGKTYHIPASDAYGNAIHGFVHTRPWRVIERDRRSLVGQFQASVDDPALRDQWPADFRITASYDLSGGMLRMVYLIENPSDAPLPCGLGTHPYFHVPFLDGPAKNCLILLPGNERWELEQMLPTGNRNRIDNVVEYRAGTPFGGLQLDDVFTDLDFEDGWCRSHIYDPAAKLALHISFSSTFRECVVFTPPHREAICIEPYTCVPNAAELLGKGIDTGLRVLPPGESFIARVELAVSEIDLSA
ncbi:Aldose 1-epimerase [Anatilimnocola aggregata]|uniref:Aldose 1-epimerase n=1 Tax=Anatilimnocola aggregata TaxID=2528021 RepID=A0A517YNP6_9BACT|nr:aldose 1-epimerase [Anatilimnocola aggregata]QDU31852.1 Aldose 1-epimerase [Anatilimnocola aggregata]